MTKEQLIALGFTDEQADQIIGEVEAGYVSKSRYSDVEAELNQVRSSLKERDKQLETLKAAVGDADETRKQITALQEENKAKDESHAEELRRLRLDSAIDLALVSAKAKNVKAARAMLDEFMKTAEIDDKGEVKGLSDAVKQLVDSEDTKFLFEQRQFKITGAMPVEGADRDISKMGAYGDAVGFAKAVAKSQNPASSEAQGYYFNR